MTANDNAPSGPPGPAWTLGLAGLLPFFGLAAASALAPDGALRAAATTGLLGYGAVILSFMGGCRWGFAAAGLGQGPRYGPLLLSVVPALYAWAFLWWRLSGAALGVPLSAESAALALAAGFVGLYLADAAAARAGDAPAWWPQLRLPLTLGAAGSLIAAATF